MALTKIGTGGIKDDAASQATIADEAIDEARLQISNAGSNGQFLQKQSGNTGGLTWASAGGASSIADDSITEVKLDIHADPSGTDKFLAYTSNGMEWAVPTDTNTQLSTEQVQDIVGAMFTGNTETNITATYEDSDGTIDLVSTNTQVGGATGVDFNDDVKARFGAGNDLQLYHTGSYSAIDNSTGVLYYLSNSQQIMNQAGSETMATFTENGAVAVYYDNEKKFETTADGAKVQDLSANTVELELTTAQGDGGSLYADTAASPSGTLGLTTTSGDWAVKSHNDGNVELYHDGTKKIETTAAGVTVTGTVTDDKGELRTIPQLSKSSKHTIVLADAGKHSINSSGGWEFDTSTAFTAGMAITLINNSGSDQTIEADGVTLYNTADAATGNRTLAGRGMATVICTASNTYYISGAGLS